MNLPLPGNNQEDILLQNIKDLERYVDDLRHFIPIPICGTNITNVIFEINDSFIDFFGYGDYEVVGENISILFADKKTSDEIKAKILRNKKVNNYKTVIKKKNQENVEVLVSAMARYDEDNKIIGYYISFNDISALVEIQKELKEKVKEMERLNKFMVGRELKMIELKKQIKDLKNKIKRM